MLNAGIVGNRLTADGAESGESAVKRVDEDVLSRSDVRSLIVFEGINDIQQHHHGPVAIEAALEQIAYRAHARGLNVIGATITPFKGAPSYNDDLEGIRVAVNGWIRDSTGVFDTVADFDKTIADQDDPHRIRPDYSYDCLHLNDKGYQAVADAVDLNRL